jgi:hypothetical protein
MGGLRAWLFHRNSNGFSACVRQIGKKILIDEDEALAWIDRQQGGAA